MHKLIIHIIIHTGILIDILVVNHDTFGIVDSVSWHSLTLNQRPTQFLLELINGDANGFYLNAGLSSV